jgi:hypothetical protein
VPPVPPMTAPRVTTAHRARVHSLNRAMWSTSSVVWCASSCIAGGVLCSMRVWAIADAHYDDRGVARVGGPIFFYFLGYRVEGVCRQSV